MNRYQAVRRTKKGTEGLHIGVFMASSVSHVNVNRSTVITLNSTKQAIEIGYSKATATTYIKVEP
jgi:hypothetical protein